MKKKIMPLLTVFLSVVLCFAFAACYGNNGTPDPVDYGTLTVADITLTEGETADITATFSIADKAEAITYTFEGSDISIENGKVTAFVGGKTVIVIAKTAHHETTFTVTTTEIDYGTLSVSDITLTECETADIVATFSIADKAEEIAYTFEGSDISIENGKVTALVGGKTVTVTAKTAHHETTFTVTTTEIDYGTLSVSDITLEEGETADIAATFSIADKAEEITYSFEGNDIAIENGKVTALVGGKTVIVTARTAHHETTFTVTTTEIDYGTLTIMDIEGLKTTSNRAKIMATFSIADKAEAITYTFEGNDIAIENGYVTALVGGKAVIVTATTAHHETTFTVTTLVDYGSLVFYDVYAWVGYTASELDYEYQYPEYAEELTFTYDNSKISIDTEKMTVTAKTAGEVLVTVSSEHFLAEFVVTCQTVNKNDVKYNTNNYNSKVAGYKSDWDNNGHDGSTVLFIGDSFFDSYFWTDFYKTYAGKDALRAGVSSSTSYDWEVFAESFVKFTSPKAIAMHIGTNNVYDDFDDVNTAVSALQRMFYVIHEAVPETPIYWFNISQRSYDTAKQAMVSSINSIMAQWCARRSWITCLDTSSKLTNDMLKDNVHPKVENYYVFVDALKNAGLEINDKPLREGIGFTGIGNGAFNFNSVNKTFTGDNTGAQTRAIMLDGETPYEGNFAVSGKMNITSVYDGGVKWVELLVTNAEGAASNAWFNASKALPMSCITFADSGSSEMWGYRNGGKNLGITVVDGKSFDFTVIAYNKSILMKINNVVKVWEDNDFTGTVFGFGFERVGFNVTDFSAVINDNAAILAKYNDNAPTVSKSIDDIERTVSQAVGNEAWTAEYMGKSLNRNYVLSGKLDITDTGTNGHIQFMFSDYAHRILIWDNETNGNFKIGYANGNYVSSAPANATYKFTKGQTLTLTWKLVVTGNDAYFYMNNELRLVWKNIPGSNLTLSSENVACKFYDMKAMTLEADGAEYNAEIAAMNDTITKYASATGTVRA